MSELNPRWQRASEMWHESERWGQLWDPAGVRRPRARFVGIGLSAALGFAALVLAVAWLGP
jgi:hypothetical protein